MGGDSGTRGSQLMQRLGEEAKIILTKFWIWVVAFVLFGIGITGERMTIFRIIYMALALIFLLTFQVKIVSSKECFTKVINSKCFFQSLFNTCSIEMYCIIFKIIIFSLRVPLDVQDWAKYFIIVFLDIRALNFQYLNSRYWVLLF